MGAAAAAVACALPREAPNTAVESTRFLSCKITVCDGLRVATGLEYSLRIACFRAPSVGVAILRWIEGVTDDCCRRCDCNRVDGGRGDVDDGRDGDDSDGDGGGGCDRAASADLHADRIDAFRGIRLTTAL